MAFISKVGNLLKQNLSRYAKSELSASSPSIFQAIRCMSSSKVFVGGLSYNTDDQNLREAFTAYGEVIEARVIMDRETGRSRGFGFVSYTSTEEASSAIQALDGQDLDGRRVKVNYATDRAGGFHSGGYGGGGGGYGGGGYGGGGAYGGDNSYESGGGSSYGGGGSGYGGAGNYSSGRDYGATSDGGSGFGGRNVAGFGGSANGGSYGGGGGGGSDNFVSRASSMGGDGSHATGSYGGSSGMAFGYDQYGSNPGNNAGAAKGSVQDYPEGNYMDNDEPRHYANKSG
ncbi:glycine-rich RNA-binding protein blt801-like [Telopea speciosissima]|uniref:glycine-rich RNA-binding protein blt801-like n=1 Tax=Telopea speciosissima TaxID=54955 RepID=UPI001CC62F30|nr:glycine-rich RNA-binding protein blt801-like [Telopea speciosissima]